MAGMGLVIVFLLVGVFGPLAIRVNPLQTDPGALFFPPSPGHPFGTDNLGRDIFAGIIWGTRTALLVGTLAVAGAYLLGLTVGSLAGYVGGTLDRVLVRLAELFIVIPRLFLAMVLVALFGASQWIIIATLALVGWPQVARLVRAEFMSLRTTEFVEAAHSLGASSARVIVQHMLPNTAPTLAVNASLQISAAILLEAGLAFFGLEDPGQTSWGAMLSNAQQFLGVSFWMPFFPGLALSLTGLGLNLLGDGLTSVLTPRLRSMRG